ADVALEGSGLVSLTAGTGGIVAASAAANAFAEISTTGDVVSLNTTGTIGTSTSPIQLAANANLAEQVVNVGASAAPSALFLGGLGDLTVGNVSVAGNAAIFAAGN